MARDGLGSVGAQLLGVIVNDMSANPGDDYSYHGYQSEHDETTLAHASGAHFD
jgi:hypothetical protein